MKNKIAKFLIITILINLLSVNSISAAILDPNIPAFNPNLLVLSSDGSASFTPPVYVGSWKRFDIQLLKRVTTATLSGTLVYTYKTQGSIKHVEPTEKSYDFTISSIGYYQFQIRGVNLEGNYGPWTAIYDNNLWVYNKSMYPGVAVTEDDIGVGGSIGSGTGVYWNDYYYGPGVNNYYSGYNYQNGVIGPNGQIIYNNGTNQYQANNNYPQVTSPYAYDNYQYNNGQNYQYNNGQNYQNEQTNPNYYSGNYTNNYNNYNNYNYNSGSTPQISQALEIGWHVDSNGRFYYQGNGVVLKSTWYFIDGNYYRFSDNGYVLANQWFQDNATGYWYYLNGDGKMLTGWQCINGAWYYFKPENGNGYGTMYRNTSLQITDRTYGTGYYAFDSNGVTVMNAWYGGYYYGRDGKRTN